MLRIYGSTKYLYRYRNKKNKLAVIYLLLIMIEITKCIKFLFKTEGNIAIWYYYRLKKISSNLFFLNENKN